MAHCFCSALDIFNFHVSNRIRVVPDHDPTKPLGLLKPSRRFIKAAFESESSENDVAASFTFSSAVGAKIDESESLASGINQPLLGIRTKLEYIKMQDLM